MVHSPHTTKQTAVYHAITAWNGTATSRARQTESANDFQVERNSSVTRKLSFLAYEYRFWCGTAPSRERTQPDRLHTCCSDA